MKNLLILTSFIDLPVDTINIIIKIAIRLGPTTPLFAICKQLQNHLRDLTDGHHYCDNCHDEENDAIEKGLQTLNDDKLFQIHKAWKDVQEKRENEWLRNIYNYSKQHTFNRAMFYFGSAHRKSIMQKIRVYEMNEKIKLNWIFYNPLNT